MTGTMRRPSDRPIRPMPEGFVRPPRYFYPSERARLPRDCGHCGTRLLVIDQPTAEHPISDHACWLCSRSNGELVHDSLWRPTKAGVTG